jgi:hypothetical protein
MTTYRELAEEAELKTSQECQFALEVLDENLPGSVMQMIADWASKEPNQYNTVEGFLRCCDPRRYLLKDEVIVLIACAYRHAMTEGFNKP